jgi:hypothetical protein
MDFPAELLDEIQARLPVSEVVGIRVKLKKVGREWKGLSPFREEKAPSFFVNDEKRLWFDFATGRNGNIFDFVMALEGISFSVAVEKLAASAGVDLPAAGNQSSLKRADIRTWLRQQPHQVSSVYAARAALRAIPELVTALGPRGGGVKEIGSSIILPAFRASAAAWVASRFPNRAALLRSAAASAAESAFSAAGDVDTAGAVAACVAAARAAAAAARAAADTQVEADAAARALETAFEDARKSPNVFANFALAGATADMEILNEGAAIEDIARRELWLKGIPAGVSSEWARLENALLKTNEHWEVWTEWYSARLEGTPISEKLEFARARLPLDIWARGAESVNAQIKELIRDHTEAQGRPQPVPLENVPSPFEFQLSDRGTIALMPSSTNWPSFPHLTSKQDHASRLDVCRTLAKDLVSDLGERRFQARREYAEGLERYSARLPVKAGEGNMLLADAEARTIRNLFAAEVDVLSLALAAKLQTFLEQHMGLRVFYPEIAAFYRDVQNGRITEPLPLDAIQGFISAVKEGTPVVFESPVQVAIGGMEATPVAVVPAGPSGQLVSNQPIPPKDPLGNLDPQKASDFTVAGVTNGLWRIFLKGEKLNKAAEGWIRTANLLRPHVNEILNWLDRFLNSNGGLPPSPH